MNLYLTAAGEYAGTQKDAGKGHRGVEVPTDKAGLIAYLNAMAPASPVQSLQPPQAPCTHETVILSCEGPFPDKMVCADCGLVDPKQPVEIAVSEYGLKIDGMGRIATDYEKPLEPHDNYQSPMTARTNIAGIDAGMVAAAVRQFSGKHLAKVMTAGMERMAELARGLD